MSMWEFTAAVDGYIEANSPADGNELSGEDQDRLWKLVNQKMGHC